MKWLYRSLFLIVFGTTAAHAQTNDMFGVWGSFVLKGDFSSITPQLDGFSWQIKNQARTREDSASGSRLTENLLFVQTNYQLSSHISLAVGYVHDWLHPLRRPAFQESRVYEDFVWKQRIADFKLTARTRIDQRINQTSGDDAYRARQFFKLSHAVPNVRHLSVYVGDEVMFYLNKNSFGKRGFTENRVLAGFHYQLQPELGFNLGYLGQFVDTKTANNLFTHNLTAGISWTF